MMYTREEGEIEQARKFEEKRIFTRPGVGEKRKGRRRKEGKCKS